MQCAFFSLCELLWGWRLSNRGPYCKNRRNECLVMEWIAPMSLGYSCPPPLPAAVPADQCGGSGTVVIPWPLSDTRWYVDSHLSHSAMEQSGRPPLSLFPCRCFQKNLWRPLPTPPSRSAPPQVDLPLLNTLISPWFWQVLVGAWVFPRCSSAV